MMFAFTHLFSAWLLGKGLAFFCQRKLSHGTWFFLLAGSILPDADFLVDWLLGTEIHRTITHSLIFPLLGFLFVYLFTGFFSPCFFSAARPSAKREAYSLAFAIGLASHLLLDLCLPPGVPLFWPSLLHFSLKGVVFFDPVRPSFLHGSLSVLRRILRLAILDMALGVAWLFYLWSRGKVRF